METYISSKTELNETVQNAVEKAVTNRLPEIIRRATRKEYLTIKETCELLNVSRRHLQYLRDSSQLNYVKSGRKIYFRTEDLEQFFDENYINQKEAQI
jgi:excisionase family DNA binding protein